MKVTAFNGSPRREGNTSLLIGHALGALNKEGITTELVQVGGEKLHGCIACYQCFSRKDKRCAVADDIANSCIEKMLESDGIIIGSAFKRGGSWRESPDPARIRSLVQRAADILAFEAQAGPLFRV